MIDVDNADGRANTPNTLAQAKSQLHSLEQAAGGIRFYLNVNKAEFICF